MNSKEYWGLSEAYAEVYAPQKEFQLWVNSLLEEGYDLSDYTWEDMYEVYLGEQGTRTGSNPNVWKPTPSGPGSRRGAAPVPSSSSSGSVTTQRGTRTGSNPNVWKPATTTSGPAGGGMGGRRGGGSSPGSLRPAAPTARPAAPAPTARPAASSPTARPAAPTARPAAPTARPAATAPAAKPSAPTPKATPTPSASTTSAAPKRTFNPLMQKTFGYQTGYAPDQVKKDPKKMAQMGSLKSISSGLDMFDLVKGHLLDEGYADTEESAIAIMANMSEEWRQSIIEGGINFSVPSRTDDFNNRRDELKNRYKQDVGPRIPGPGGGGQNGEPPAPKAMGLRLAKAKGTSNSKNA